MHKPNRSNNQFSSASCPSHNKKELLATEVVKILHRAGFQAYWVGGCVRDRVMGKIPSDYDISTNATPEQIQSLFSKTIDVGKSFGVMRVIIESFQFEISTFRVEELYEDGRRPKLVRFTSDPVQDALRRDFTINGLFYDPECDLLHDWVGGVNDIKACIIRTIGDPYRRFNEDYLRLLRAVRFAAQLNFKVESSTWDAICKLHQNISRISKERIRDELIKLLKPPYAARGLELLRESGLLNIILPEVVNMIGCEQPAELHPEGDVYTHTLKALELLPEDVHPLLPWAVLFHDIGKPSTRQVLNGQRIRFPAHERVGATIAQAILERLRFSKEEIETICWLVKWHMIFKDIPYMRDSKRREFLLHPLTDLLLELYKLDKLACYQQPDLYEPLKQERKMLLSSESLKQPLINGRDLLNLGLKPGPIIGKILKIIREKQLAGEICSAGEAIEYVKSNFLQNS